MAGLLPVLVAIGICYTIAQIIFNIFFHPLANIPGPALARASLLWRIVFSLRGRFHRDLQSQHAEHGKVVRVSPNELSFASSQAWKDIYGPAASPDKVFIKSEFYDVYGSGFDSLCIGSERDPEIHQRMKRRLLPAFSPRSLSEQEHIIQCCTDQFIEKLHIDGGLCERNMTDWYEMIAFDILGEMAFGESFGCVADGRPHPWQQMISKHLYFITVLDNLRRYPWIRNLGQLLLPRLTVEVRNKHASFCRDKVKRRMLSSDPRKDFLTQLVDDVNSGKMSTEELTAHTSTLVLAGGETVSTFLAAVTYYLGRNEAILHRLQGEIRGRFASYDDISSKKALQLPYLQAIIQEGLRIYPPGSQGFPRISPGACVDGVWVPQGTEVYCSAWTITHSDDYFDSPNLFNPDRWLDPNCKDDHAASQPFSLGPRGCIGKSFALVELSLILTKMHFAYNIELVDQDLDWEGRSHIHVQWWKPALFVRFTPASRSKLNEAVMQTKKE